MNYEEETQQIVSFLPGNNALPETQLQFSVNQYQTNPGQ